MLIKKQIFSFKKIHFEYIAYKMSAILPWGDELMGDYQNPIHVRFEYGSLVMLRNDAR